MKKLLIITIIVFIWSLSVSYAQQVKTQGITGELIAGPADLTHRQEWLDTLIQWRKAEKKKLNYTNKEYLLAAVKLG